MRQRRVSDPWRVVKGLPAVASDVPVLRRAQNWGPPRRIGYNAGFHPVRRSRVAWQDLGFEYPKLDSTRG